VWWLEDRQPRRKIFTVMFAIMAWFWPVSFYLGYFEFFEQTGGRSHLTFHTAPVEPKLAAFRLVLADSDLDSPIEIVCHEWWNRWPLEYLALGQHDVRVVTWDDWQLRGKKLPASPPGNTWFVEFAGSAAECETLAKLADERLTVDLKTICDFGGHPLLTLIRPLGKDFQNY